MHLFSSVAAALALSFAGYQWGVRVGERAGPPPVYEIVRDRPEYVDAMYTLCSLQRTWHWPRPLPAAHANEIQAAVADKAEPVLRAIGLDRMARRFDALRRSPHSADVASEKVHSLLTEAIELVWFEGTQNQ